ncbi:hypothetical protein OH77DRAFT_1362196, partial [Trametes cingulata]
LVASTANTQELTLRNIFHFLQTWEIPDFTSSAAQNKFLRKCQQYFVKEGHMYRRYAKRMPVRVVFSKEERQQILKEAHD